MEYNPQDIEKNGNNIGAKTIVLNQVKIRKKKKNIF